jgi:hypothetical protein
MQMGVEAAFGNFQRLDQFVNGALPLHGLHDAEPCGGISADKMLQAFLPGMNRGWRAAPLNRASALSLHDGHVSLSGTGRRNG